jgi:hypothetical protein
VVDDKRYLFYNGGSNASIAQITESPSPTFNPNRNPAPILA